MALATAARRAAFCAAAMAGLAFGGCTRRAERPAAPATSAPAPGIAPIATERRRVTFRTADDVVIAAWLYPAADRGAPAVVLAHHLSGNRDEWDEFVRVAKAASPALGTSFLALDLRGHGESTGRAGGGPALDWREFADAEWRKLEDDLKAALVYLRSGVDVAPARIALVGSSIGSSAALFTMAHDPQIAATVALSPGLEYHGLDTRGPASALSGRPVLLVAARGDADSAAAAAALHALCRGSAEHVYEQASAHGVALAAQAPDLYARIIEFLREKLRGS